MANKILYISKKSTLSEKYATIMEGAFTLEQRSITTKALYRELVDVSMILIYVTSFTKEEADELYSFLTIMPNTPIPVVLLGSPYDIKREKANLRYPISAEIDASARTFHLTDELNLLLEKFNPVSKKVIASVTKKTLTVFNRDANLLERAKPVLISDYDLNMTTSPKEFLSFLMKKNTDLIVIDFLNEKAEETEALISSLRNNTATMNVPFIVYGEYMTNEQKDRLLSLGAKEVLCTSDDALVCKEAVDRILR